MKTLVIAAVLTGALTAAHAQPLTIVQTSAPAINCLYASECTLVVEDTHTGITSSDGTLVGSLQSRRFFGQGGALLEGLYGYQYRVVVPEGQELPSAPCLEVLDIEFSGAVIPVEYTESEGQGEVYVITTGGLGAVAPVAAERIGSRLVFQFPAPFVCAGESTFFFGVTSPTPPE